LLNLVSSLTPNMSLDGEQVRRQERHPNAANGTDQKRYTGTCREIALEARVAELEAEIRARDEFLAIAAHELRNPMTPIAAWVELLLNLARREPSRLSPQMRHGLERLEALVEAYVRRATTFLDVSRISSQNLQLTITELDLSALVRDTITAMIPAAQNAGCQIAFAVQESVVGSLDRMAVEQIVENLLSNAVRYGAGQPIEVTLSSNDSTAQLTIRDRGIGICEADQARIFDQFQRAKTNNTGGGFGVGLWITRQLVAAMGGEISVTSKLGLGSTFTVVLPLKGG
jgi:two-component system, OmpR family, sensor kinase